MRVSIPNLLPGTEYAIQVRADDGSAKSGWSARYEVETVTDNVLPKAPANVSWNVTGDSFTGEWDSVESNVNNDFSLTTRYEVELVANGVTKVVSVPQKTGTRITYTLSFEDNRALFGTPRPNITMRVRAVDNKNLKGDYSSPAITAINPAPNPVTNLVATAGVNSISLNWTPPNDTDLIGYNVYAQDETWIAFVNATGYTYSTLTYSAQSFKVAAVDKFNQDSGLVESNAVTPDNPFLVDNTPPANPTNVGVATTYDYTRRESNLDVSWTASTSSDVAEYTIRYGATSNGPWNYVKTNKDATSARINVTPGQVQHVSVRATDFSANNSDWVSATGSPITSAADTKAPAQVTGLSAVVAGSSFNASWSAVTTNSDATPINDFGWYEVGVKNGTTEVFFIVSDTKYQFHLEQNRLAFGTPPKAAITFRVRAVDRNGLAGAWSANATATNTEPAPPTTLVEALGANAITLRWTASTSDDVIRYNVYQGGTANPTTKVGEVSGTVFTTTSNTTGQYFSIRAVDAFELESSSLSGGPFTATNPFLVDTTPPAVPTNLAANITNNANGVGARAAVTWTAVSADDLAGYVVSYKRNADSVWTETNYSKDVTSGTIELPSAYTAYDFRIRSFDRSANYSAWSAVLARPAVANVAPGNVAGLTGTSTTTSITYSWTALTVADLAGYEVTFSTSSTFASGNITYLTGTANTLTVSGLNPNTPYYARVRAIDTGGMTSAAWSATNTTTTKTYSSALSDGNAPASSPTPTVTGEIGYLFARWTPVANNDPVTYDVHVSTTTGFTPAAGTKVGETSSTTFNILKDGSGAALVYGTTYFVRLIARDADGAAAASTQGSAAPRRAVVTDVTLSPGDIGAPTNTEFNNLTGKVDESIKSYSVEYAVNSSETVAPTTGWSTATPTRTPGSYIWTRTVVTYHDNASVTTNPALLTGNDGAQGVSGRGISTTTVNYAKNNSPSSEPTTGWVASPPATSPGEYLWTRTYTTYTDNLNPTTAYSVAAHGTTGTDGRGISGTAVEYTKSTDGVTPPSTGWVASPIPTTVAGEYLWTRTVITYTSGSPTTTTSHSVARHGATGVSATLADVGNDAIAIPVTAAGAATAAGSISIPFSGWIGSTRAAATISYSTLPAGITLGSNTAATTSANGNLVLNYASGATIGSGDLSNITLTVTTNGQAFTRQFSISRAYAGAAGSNGTSATNLDATPDVFMVPTTSAGAALSTGSTVVTLRGFVGSTASTVTIGTAPTLPAGITATPSAPGTTATITFNWANGANIGGSASSGTFNWPVTVNGLSFSVTIGWARAVAGTDGSSGVSITSVTPFYAQVSTGTTPAQPADGTATPASPWSVTEPDYVANTDLWRVERISLSSGGPNYTTRQKVSSYAAAATAITTANGKNKIYHSTGTPGSTPNTAGDTWIRIDDTATPNRVIGQWRGTGGTSWLEEKIDDQFIANLNVSKLVSGSISTATLTLTSGGVIESENYATVANGFRLSASGLAIKGSPFTISNVTGLASDLASKETPSGAQAKADAATSLAINAAFQNANVDFSNWPSGAYPSGVTAWNGTVPVKETSIVRTGGNALRFNNAASQTGVYLSNNVEGIVPLSDYIMVEADVYLVSGTFSGAGIMVWWNGANAPTDDRFSFHQEAPNPQTGRWYRFSKLMKRPNLAGTHTGWSVWAFANYSFAGVTQTSKSIIFDKVGFRNPTTEELAAYNATGYVQSKGTDLVVNGYGTLGNNTNFGFSTFTAADAPDGAAGSFLSPNGLGGTYLIDEFLPVDPNRRMRFSYQIRQTGESTTARQYGMLVPYDAYKNQISPAHYMFNPGTTTTLAAPLNPGDTTVTLTSSANWFGQSGKPAGGSVHLRSIIFWDYVDAGGKAWPEHTYSRNYLGTNAWEDGGIVGNVITLSAPYAGPARPAGTKLSNGSSGGSFMYSTGGNAVVAPTWFQYSDSIQGLLGGTEATGRTSASFALGWPPGTSYAKVGWLLNRTPSGPSDTASRMAVAAVTLSDATAAQELANAAQTTATEVKNLTTPWTFPGQTTINGAMLQTGTVTAAKMLVTDTNNYLENPLFEHGLTGWTGDVNWSVGTSSMSYINRFVSRSAAGATSLTNNLMLEVTEGDILQVTGKRFHAVAGSAVRIAYYSSTGTLLTTPEQIQPISSDWADFTFEHTVPANTYYASLRLVHPGGSVSRWANLVFRRKFAGSLIVDGSLAAEKITTGELKSATITLTAGGIIKTNNSNVQINDQGIVVTGGSQITASALTAGTINATGTIKVGSTIESNVFDATTGFRLSSNGLIIRSGEVAASALRAGTLTSDTGVIEIGAGAGLVLNGGYLKSNTNTATTLAAAITNGNGFFLNNDGLFIGGGANGGKVMANALVSDTLTSTTITLGTGGIIQTANYNGTAGFRLSSTGLEIPDGTISASKINISSTGGRNLWDNSSFEKDTNGAGAGYLDGWTLYSNGGGSATSRVTGGRTGGHAVRVTATTTSSTIRGLYRNINHVGGFKTGVRYTLSFYARGAGVFVGRQASIASNAPVPTNARWHYNPTLTANWQRYVYTFERTDTTDSIYWGFSGAGVVNDYIEYDDVMIEESEFPSAYSQFNSELTPGYTTIDGGLIKTGAIQSTNYNATTKTGWIINTNGAAEFANLNVWGDTTVGTGTANYIRSAGGSTTVGWFLRGDGSLFAQSADITGKVTATSGQIGGTTITSTALTGGIIQTSTSATAGIKLDSTDGIRAFNGSATPVFQVAANGNTTIGGTTTISGTTTLGGNLNLNGGTLSIGTGSITGNFGTLNNAGLTLNAGSVSASTITGIDATFANTITGTATTIDGGIIKTGEIRSNGYSEGDAVTGAGAAGWAINTTGNATFAGVRILGNAVLGKGTGDTSSILQSSNFTASTGWQIKGDGSATFNNITAYGTLQNSTTYSTTATGWQILANGTANFTNLNVYGDTTVGNGAANFIKSQTFDTTTGWKIDGAGLAEFRNATITGSITAKGVDAYGNATSATLNAGMLQVLGGNNNSTIKLETGRETQFGQFRSTISLTSEAGSGSVDFVNGQLTLRRDSTGTPTTLRLNALGVWASPNLHAGTIFTSTLNAYVDSGDAKIAISADDTNDTIYLDPFVGQGGGIYRGNLNNPIQFPGGFIGNGGTKIRTMDYGLGSGSTNSNALMTISHSLGTTPNVFVLQSRVNGTNTGYSITAVSSTSITCRVWNLAGDRANASSIGYYYWCATV